MKKVLRSIVLLAALVATLVSLVSCLDVYDADPKTFRESGLEITLTKAFEYDGDDAEEGVVAFYVSSQAAVAISRERFSESVFVDLDKLSEEDCAELFATSVDLPERPSVSDVDGLHIVEYSAESEGESFSYLVAVRKSADSVWFVEFYCFSEDYTEFRPHFLKWARSISFVD